MSNIRKPRRNTVHLLTEALNSWRNKCSMYVCERSVLLCCVTWWLFCFVFPAQLGWVQLKQCFTSAEDLYIPQLFKWGSNQNYVWRWSYSNQMFEIVIKYSTISLISVYRLFIETAFLFLSFLPLLTFIWSGGATLRLWILHFKKTLTRKKKRLQIQCCSMHQNNLSSGAGLWN